MSKNRGCREIPQVGTTESSPGGQTGDAEPAAAEGAIEEVQRNEMRGGITKSSGSSKDVEVKETSDR